MLVSDGVARVYVRLDISGKMYSLFGSSSAVVSEDVFSILNVDAPSGIDTVTAPEPSYSAVTAPVNVNDLGFFNAVGIDCLTSLILSPVAFASAAVPLWVRVLSIVTELPPPVVGRLIQ